MNANYTAARLPKFGLAMLALSWALLSGCDTPDRTSKDGQMSAETAALANSDQPTATGTEPPAQNTNPDDEPPVSWDKLFDGESMDGWEIANFGTENDILTADGEMTIEMAYPLGGVFSTREDLPTQNYELMLDAKKTQGIDFFCGLTFPVEDAHCTLIVGGWGGAVVGLSCVDGKDAARNETKTVQKFENDRWYKIRVKVTNKVEVWIDEKQVVDFEREGHELSLRAETLVTKPLGICAFETTAVYRDIKLRKLSKSNP